MHHHRRVYDTPLPVHLSSCRPRPPEEGLDGVGIGEVHSGVADLRNHDEDEHIIMWRPSTLK